MKFNLSSSELLKKLQFLSGVLNSSNTMPILDNFLFKIENKVLTITASDMETTMSTTMEVDYSGAISVAIPAKLLIEVLKTFPTQPLEFTVNENATIEIKSATGEYEIAYYNGSEYPNLPVVENTSKAIIPANVLNTAITKTLFATGNDDLRPVMCGVFFHLAPTGLIFVATDAHKLVKYSRTDIQSTEDAQFVVPKKPLGVLKTMLGSVSEDVVIEYNISNAIFSFESYTVTCRLVDAKYPNYEVVIPKDNPTKVIIARDLLLSSVKRVSTFSNKNTHQIRFKVTGQELNISAQDLDYSNKADERLSCNHDGADIHIGFNSRFLAEMLSNIQSDEVQIEMSSPVRAGILTAVDGMDEGENLLMLVMPVKLD